MATKTITITEEAYNLLKSAKSEGESFTKAIVRIAKKDPLSKLVGLLSKEEADDLRAHIKASRRETEEKLGKIRERLE